MRGRRLPALAVVAAVGLLGAGCAKIEPSREFTASQLFESLEQPPVLAEAIDSLIGDCMARGGHAYNPGYRTPPDSGPNPMGLFGLRDDREIARKYGFEAAVIPSPLEEEMPPGYSTFLYGSGDKTETLTMTNGTEISTPVDGCYSAATTEIYSSLQNYLSLMALPNEALLASPGINAIDTETAMESYSECMTAAGFRVSSLTETQALVTTRFGQSRPQGSAPSPAEAELAVADADCQAGSGLRRLLVSEFQDYAGEWIKTNAALIERLHGVHEETVARAKDVIDRRERHTPASP